MADGWGDRQPSHAERFSHHRNPETGAAVQSCAGGGGSGRADRSERGDAGWDQDPGGGGEAIDAPAQDAGGALGTSARGGDRVGPAVPPRERGTDRDRRAASGPAARSPTARSTRGVSAAGASSRSAVPRPDARQRERNGCSQNEAQRWRLESEL